MPYNHEKINNLTGGYYCVYKDGSVIVEGEISWNEMPNKKDIKILGLKRHNKHYELENKVFGAPGETHMKQLSICSSNGEATTTSTLVSWFLSYYTPTEKVIFRVDAITGKTSEEKIPY